MQLTVLGSGAAYPRPGGACAGFLVSSGSTHVWVDAGNGTFARLQEHIPYRDLDALILTHGHADHVSDVLPLMYALGFDPELPEHTIPVYAPPEVGVLLSWPLGPTSKEIFQRVLDLRSIADPFEIGTLRFGSFRTKHPAETYGLRISEGDATMVYTSDTAMFPELADHCRGADLLLAEATYIDGVEASPGVHLWARESGMVASQAGAKRLVLTHIWPTFETDIAVKEAAEEFSGPVEAAVEGAVYSI